MEIGGWERSFIKRQRVARLATVDAQGQPHVVPIVYAFDSPRLFTPINAKPKRVDPHQLQRVRNIQSNPQVAVIIDEYSDDWNMLAWVQLRGRAKVVKMGPEQAAGVVLLEAKYDQYKTMPLAEKPLIIITVNHVVSWSAMNT